ncbi:MAG: c-type cytochrome [Cyclobacteriaceae bacterium]
MNPEHRLIQWINMIVSATWLILLLCGVALIVINFPELWINTNPSLAETIEAPKVKSDWSPPDSNFIPKDEAGRRIRYGQKLVAHTAAYLGPAGSVMQITNGMNCQNCHLESGTKLFGNNYAGVASTYPKFRPRSGTIETIEKRVNDCIQRSLNGRPLSEESEEMKSFVAYIQWVGSQVPKDSIPKGTGIKQPALLDRPADPEKGKLVYEQNCARCHGTNGEGMKVAGSAEWLYPPLYGPQSYNTGAGLYRLSRFAGYVKYNMPNDLATPEKPFLTDEQCWDVAAFVNSMSRPGFDISSDWPDISKKPFDHPFGPFSDDRSEKEHKYGPWPKAGK